MRIDNRYKIPIDSVANVHSVSAIGEQYLDLVSTGNPGQYYQDGQTITQLGTVPSEVGPALDSANRGLAVLPKEKIDAAADRNIASGGRIGACAAAAGRLARRTSRRASRTTCRRSTTSSRNSTPILESQVDSGDDDRAVVAQPEHHRRADRRTGLGAAQRAAAGRADARSGGRGVQRCPRLAAADAGEPGRRHRHAQALPQGSRADAGDLAAGRRRRAGGHDLRQRWPAALRRCRSTSRRRV